MSLIEAATNVVVGYALALAVATQIMVFEVVRDQDRRERASDHRHRLRRSAAAARL